jgi:hypothetical protein
MTSLPRTQPQLKGVNFEPQTTQTARKTLNPVWNEQLKCDVADDCLLQDEPLQLRVFDKDIFSADDLIGTVYVHCNSLYEGLGKGSFRTDRKMSKDEHRRRQIDGWFPIYDTMRGICGELKVTVYIQHIMDFNPGTAAPSPATCSKQCFVCSQKNLIQPHRCPALCCADSCRGSCLSPWCRCAPPISRQSKTPQWGCKCFPHRRRPTASTRRSCTAWWTSCSWRKTRKTTGRHSPPPHSPLLSLSRRKRTRKANGRHSRRTCGFPCEARTQDSTRKRTHARASIHVRTHAHARTRAHAQTRTHTNTHVRAHKNARTPG